MVSQASYNDNHDSAYSNNRYYCDTSGVNSKNPTSTKIVDIRIHSMKYFTKNIKSGQKPYDFHGISNNIVLPILQ